MLKKIILGFAIMATTVSVFAQGTVNFNNSVAFTAVADRNVYFGSVGGTLLVGTQWKAQLYVGADANSLQSISAAVSSFRATAGAGTWSGGSRTLTTTTGTSFVAGDTVQLAVRVWDIGTGATWDVATSKGTSAAFSYSVPAAGSPPGAFYMEGLRAFAVTVPEPSTFAFAGIGILGLIMARRRK
jgi:hypothetical protein